MCRKSFNILIAGIPVTWIFNSRNNSTGQKYYPGVNVISTKVFIFSIFYPVQIILKPVKTVKDSQLILGFKFASLPSVFMGNLEQISPSLYIWVNPSQNNYFILIIILNIII